ncbi:uncharacterized protein BDV14DRAFT_190718 [Aspergillus stella-maris]|uniref:uncharacterized protein n=1 Tax=Aspergillus stella-maris TaxID=1810926 RepID=UPI003CCDFAF7
MSALEFLTDTENGVEPVDSHDKVLLIAFIYLDKPLWTSNGVFDVIEKLHAHGWSFGEGKLRFNRTTRFYRLPNLQDLPDSDSPLSLPRNKQSHLGGGAHAMKLPRWAYNVARTYLRQHLLPLETLTDIALSTIEETITRLRQTHPVVAPYSKTQACFWLEYMGRRYFGNKRRSEAPSRATVIEERFGILTAQGMHDMYEWEGKYSAPLWEASWEHGSEVVVEPDVEHGTWKSEVMWAGWPDGRVSAFAWWRGWEGELGIEEEMEFLDAVAVEEIEMVGVEVEMEMDKLDLAVRSHILLGVMRGAVLTGVERKDFLREIERGMVSSGRIEEERAGLWLREALGVMEPYVSIWDGVWPDAKERRQMLRQILVENGQLFARWAPSPHLKEF